MNTNNSTRRIEVKGLLVDITQTDDDRARDRISFALSPEINGYTFSTCARLVTSFLYWCGENDYAPFEGTGELLAFALATNGNGVLWASTRFRSKTS